MTVRKCGVSFTRQQPVSETTNSKPETQNLECHLKLEPQLHSDPLCRVVLVEPLIPENTGNISRTCVGTESELHLVEPMAFELTESRVKRAGLDYWSDLSWQTHGSYDAWKSAAEKSANRVFYIETSGTKSLFEVEFRRGDWLVFGKETSGLTEDQMRGRDAVHNSDVLYIPMPGKVRSFNLSNAAAIAVFEVFRQTSALGRV